MLIIVAPNYFTSTSNGHLVSAKLWQALISAIGPGKAVLVSGTESVESVSLYREVFGPSYYTEDELIGSSWYRKEDGFALLLPDDTGGLRSQLVDTLRNSTRCRRVYIIAFAPLFVFAPNPALDPTAVLDDRYRIIFFADWIMPPSIRRSPATIDIYQEPDPPVELVSAYVDLAGKAGAHRRNGIAVYAGKGIYRLSETGKASFQRILEIADRKNILPVTRSNPSSKALLYRLLMSCKLLICLDPFSNIEREAVSLGCQVWKPNPVAAGFIPGIYYGELTEAQIRTIFHSPSRSDYIRQSYHEYSGLLRASSCTKSKIFVRSIVSDMQSLFARSARSRGISRLCEMTLFRMNEQMAAEIMSLRAQCLECIHPMSIIPELNNSLGIDSIIRLLLGQEEAEDELKYRDICAEHISKLCSAKAA